MPQKQPPAKTAVSSFALVDCAESGRARASSGMRADSRRMVDSLFQVTAGQLLQTVIARAFGFTKQLAYIHRKPRFAPTITGRLLGGFRFAVSGRLEQHPGGGTIEFGFVALGEVEIPAGRAAGVFIDERAGHP